MAFYGNPTSTVEALKRGGGGRSGGGPVVVPKGTRSSSRHAAPVLPQASSSPSFSSPSGRSAPVPKGTRVSRRLRDVEDEWQQVPEEWLDAGAKVSGKRKARAKGGEGDKESELSDLTDEDEHQARVRASGMRTESVEMDGPEGKMMEDRLSPVRWMLRADCAELINHVGK